MKSMKALTFNNIVPDKWVSIVLLQNFITMSLFKKMPFNIAHSSSEGSNVPICKVGLFLEHALHDGPVTHCGSQLCLCSSPLSMSQVALQVYSMSGHQLSPVVWQDATNVARVCSLHTCALCIVYWQTALYWLSHAPSWTTATHWCDLQQAVACPIQSG